MGELTGGGQPHSSEILFLISHRFMEIKLKQHSNWDYDLWGDEEIVTIFGNIDSYKFQFDQRNVIEHCYSFAFYRF